MLPGPHAQRIALGPSVKGDRNFRFWADLTEALRTGEAQSEIKRSGGPFFETLYADPARLEGFMAAMDSSSRPRAGISSCSPAASRSSATAGCVTSVAPTDF